jgi:hypothetical protein
MPSLLADCISSNDFIMLVSNKYRGSEFDKPYLVALHHLVKPYFALQHKPIFDYQLLLIRLGLYRLVILRHLKV